jgi:hypothetical protein
MFQFVSLAGMMKAGLPSNSIDRKTKPRHTPMAAAYFVRKSAFNLVSHTDVPINHP